MESKVDKAALLLLMLTSLATGSEPPNILFIIVDDLRTDLGVYEHSPVLSPAIDRFAESSLVFDRAYCSSPTCTPSRASVLTGTRPWTHQSFYSSGPAQLKWHKTVGHLPTLPAWFKQNGYHTETMGKVFHGPPANRDDWTVNHYNLAKKYRGLPKYESARETVQRDQIARLQKAVTREESVDSDLLESAIDANSINYRKAGLNSATQALSWLSSDVPDWAFEDGKIADQAVASLRRLKKGDKPFFLALGFKKPHLPFEAPKKYFDLYPENEIDLLGSSFPQGIPEAAKWINKEIKSYGDINQDWDEFPGYKQVELTRAYYASISYVDAQIGKVLDELEALGLNENTIVVIWGDHGYLLGEKSIWGKHNNFELAGRVPLIVRIPSMPEHQGHRTEGIVELIDLYPTLCEAAGLEKPKHLESTSFLPLIKNPNQSWKPYAIHQIWRNAIPPGREDGKDAHYFGYAVRGERFKYVAWCANGVIKEENIHWRELYDLVADPEENNNLAGDPIYAAQIETMQAILEEGWQATIPDQATKQEPRQRP